jgi:multidrug efflux pump
MTSFFLKHPVISIVLNAMIFIIGLASFRSIDIQEYPKIEMPIFEVSTFYSNADAETIEKSITNVLEEYFTGLQGIESVTSSSMDGRSSITISFKNGISPEKALLNIREALNLAKSNLPKDVFEPTVSRATEEGLPFIAIAIESDLEPANLYHFVETTIKNSFRCIQGVANLNAMGQPYLMSIAFDAKKLFAYKVSTVDILQKIQNINNTYPVGKFRNEISTSLNISIQSEDDFRNLYLKELEGKSIFLKDVAAITLKTDSTFQRSFVNGKSGLVLCLAKTPESNPLDISHQVKEQLKKLQLPEGTKAYLVLDQADFIRKSISNIKNAILEALILVAGITFLFLRNLRATLIPLITVPISMIGSIIFLKMFGFSINTLTLLAMVLAIGLVVDDAIVVLENISKHIEKGKNVFDAAKDGAKEIGFAILAMTLTLTSVYLPILFIEGIIGKLFIEFSICLAGSVLISGFVALTLSPFMCSKILKKEDQQNFQKVEIILKKIESLYEKSLHFIINNVKYIFFLIFFIISLCILFLKSLPVENTPKEDRGIMGIYIPFIQGKTLDIIESYTKEIEEKIKTLSDVDSYMTFMGNWGGNVILNLKPHTKRKQSAQQIINQLKPYCDSLKSTDAYPWSIETGLPGIQTIEQGALTLSLSTVGSYKDLLLKVNKIKDKLIEKNICQDVRHNLKLDTMGYEIKINQNIISKLNIPLNNISSLIEIFFSGNRNFYFVKDAIRYTILLEGTTKPWTLDELYTTTPKGDCISIGTFAKLMQTTKPLKLNHLNQMRTVYLDITLKEGQDFKEAMNLLWNFEEITPDLKKEWFGTAKMYEQSNQSMLFLFTMALIFIYAILAIQFENFKDPLFIMFTVPLGVVGALLFMYFFNQSINIYTQIGLITLIGLITKHGILIIEFTNQLLSSGKTIKDAIVEASCLRLRPILMTTAAMIFGSLPLILSSDAGSEVRNAMGYVLIGGLFFGTPLTLYILPSIYWVMRKE